MSIAMQMSYHGAASLMCSLFNELQGVRSRAGYRPDEEDAHRIRMFAADFNEISETFRIQVAEDGSQAILLTIEQYEDRE